MRSDPEQRQAVAAERAIERQGDGRPAEADHTHRKGGELGAREPRGSHADPVSARIAGISVSSAATAGSSAR